MANQARCAEAVRLIAIILLVTDISSNIYPQCLWHLQPLQHRVPVRRRDAVVGYGAVSF